MTPSNLLALVRADARRLARRIALLAVGIAVGVGSLLFMLAVVSGLESLVLNRIVRTAPDRLEVAPTSSSFGPIKLQGAVLDDALLARLRAIPGVAEIYRKARLPIPSQLEAHYANFDFLTDVIVEGADDGLLRDEFGDSFATRDEKEEIPAVLPTAMVNMLNAGLTVHTGLPPLSDSALVGHHFYLRIGNSSYHEGWAETYRAQLIGISDRVTVSGPTIPMGYLERWIQKYKAPSLTVYAAVLKLAGPQYLDTVALEVKGLGLAMPAQEEAAVVTAAARALRLSLGTFAAVILLVAGIGIYNGLGMMVYEERSEIGLMRALGARRRDVLAIYLSRALWLGGCGSLAGVLAGIAACGLAARAAAHALPAGLLGSDVIFSVPGWSVLVSLAFGIATSVGGGLMPARQAASLNPADALRGT